MTKFCPICQKENGKHEDGCPIPEYEELNRKSFKTFVKIALVIQSILGFILLYLTI